MDIEYVVTTVSLHLKLNQTWMNTVAEDHENFQIYLFKK